MEKTYTITTFDDLITEVTNQISSNLYHVNGNDSDGMKQSVQDILEYIGIESLEAFKNTKESCDFWNDKNDNANYYCDLSSEWADNQVDIYNHDLWEKAKDFSEWTEQALSEGLCDMKNFTMESAFRAGQYLYYSQLSGEVCNALALVRSSVSFK